MPLTQKQADYLLNFHRKLLSEREIYFTLKEEFYSKYAPESKEGRLFWQLVLAAEKRYYAAIQARDRALAEYEAG